MEPILFKLVSENGRGIYRPSSLMSDEDIETLLTGGTITLIDEVFRLAPITSLEEIAALANAFTVPVPLGTTALVWSGQPDSNEIEN